MDEKAKSKREFERKHAARRAKDEKKFLSIVRGIWSRDKQLWPESADDKKATEQGLGWLDLPAQMRDLIRETRKLQAEILEEGVSQIVVLGMGGSSMAVEALRMAFDIPRTRLRVLDTLNTVGGLVGRTYALDSDYKYENAFYDRTDDSYPSILIPGRTLFIVSSKSGTTRETLALEKLFRANMVTFDPYGDEIKRDLNRYFIAITDAGTPLAKRRGEFREVIECSPNVGGRFSALSAFGLVPFILAGGPAESLLRPLDEMVQELQSERVEINGYVARNESGSLEYRESDSLIQYGARLGKFLYGATTNGVGKVILRHYPQLDGFGMWVEQLLAESTGKDGKGLIPITGEAARRLKLTDCDKNCATIFLPDGFTKKLTKLTDIVWGSSINSGIDSLLMFLPKEEYIGAHFLLWEFAVSFASALMELNPFDQPDVESAKRRAAQIMQKGEMVTKMPNAIKVSEIKDTIAAAIKAGDIEYIALLAYLDTGEEITQVMTELSSELTRIFNLPVLFGFGPRYLHSTGQLLKGGPQTAFVLGIWERWCDSPRDWEDWPQSTTMEHKHYVITAKHKHEMQNTMNVQAYADFEIMRERGQKVATVGLEPGVMSYYKDDSDDSKIGAKNLEELSAEFGLSVAQRNED